MEEGWHFIIFCTTIGTSVRYSYIKKIGFPILIE